MEQTHGDGTMIDIDKYEGHNHSWYVHHYESTGKHEVRVEGKHGVEDDHVCYLQYHPAFKDEQAKNAKLIADAPLLLEEVKRLRKVLELITKHNPHDPYIQWQAKESIE
jgi:hypothetical protein